MTAPEEKVPDASDQPGEASYGTRIEDAFIKERGTPFTLNPIDWQLIRGWRDRGVPADTVVRAVQEVFEGRRSRGQVEKIGSLSYCENAVEARWEFERRGLVGSGVGARNVPPEGVGPRLERLVAALRARAELEPPAGLPRAVLEKALDKAVGKIAALGSTDGFEALEEKLSRIEASLVRAIWKGLTEEVEKLLEARVLEALGDTSTTTESIRERMRRALERREVRRFASLPAVTLFEV